MMIRNVLILTLNDLAISFKNKTIYLILFIPFFVFYSLQLVDTQIAEIKNINIGLIKDEIYAPDIMYAIKASPGVFSVYHAANEEESRRWLKEKKIDGLLLTSENQKNSLVLVVLKKEALITLSIVESFSAIQKAVENKSTNWISEIRPLQEEGIQKQTLPTWTLMLVLLVGFIIMPAQVAEEKEKKLLLALLQTPIREIEWLIGKLFLGMILILIAVLVLHLLGSFKIENAMSYAAFMVVGSFCFSSYGIFLGFLCRNQASARALGVIFYLPHLLPSALSDFSQKLTAIAPFLPSYLFYVPITSILLDYGKVTTLYWELVYLFLVGLLTFIFAYVLMKKRWLM